MRQTIMLMAACAALLAGCTNEEMNEGLGIDTPIQVTATRHRYPHPSDRQRGGHHDHPGG